MLFLREYVFDVYACVCIIFSSFNQQSDDISQQVLDIFANGNSNKPTQ